jgi:hypothetical protein
MNDRFAAFLNVSRWASAIVALMYHVRYLQFVDYDAAASSGPLSKAFYFLTGLGHESFAVFFVLDGIAAGVILQHRRDRIAVPMRLGAIYRLLIPGLILGISVDLAGVQFFNQSGIYTTYPDFSTLTLGYATLLGNAFMLQPFIVPTFGSNGMLYLLSYLFWCLVLLYLFVRAPGAGKRGGRIVRIALSALAVLLMPAQFLNWAAIWLSGGAVVMLGRSWTWRPPQWLAAAGFIATLVLSRLIGSKTGLLPQPYGTWLVHYKYILVGCGFAALAWAMYPEQIGAGLILPSPPIDNQERQTGYRASFTFFFHFPIVMLLFACAAALLHERLMQQPTPARYAAFAFVVCFTIGTAIGIARAFDAVLERIYITIIPLLKSISLRMLKRE